MPGRRDIAGRSVDVYARYILYEMGQALADECIALGVDVILGPGNNMKRTPLCGRNFEYYAEDPFLGGEMVTLEEAFPCAWPNPRFEAADFAAAIVRAWKVGGGNIYIDGSPKAWEMIHGDTEWVYVIKPQKRIKGKQGLEDILTGEPLVEVYDWHRYWFDTADPNEVKPKPVLRVTLSEARKAGLDWKGHRS